MLVLATSVPPRSEETPSQQKAAAAAVHVAPNPGDLTSGFLVLFCWRTRWAVGAGLQRCPCFAAAQRGQAGSPGPAPSTGQPWQSCSSAAGWGPCASEGLRPGPGKAFGAQRDSTPA